MDPKVQAVLDLYEARDREEHARIAAGEKIPLDDQLISVGPAVGALMNMLIKETKAKSILELGTSYGGSTVWLADAARATGGRVTTIDIAANKQAYAAEMLANAGLAGHVDFITADAVDSIGKLAGPFDFVLVDLWKDLYVPCLEAFYRKLAPGALVVGDNATYPPEAYAEVKRYRDAIRSKPNMDSMLLVIGNGIELSRDTRLHQ
jgi:predicted O-methyltransferase YrrM